MKAALAALVALLTAGSAHADCGPVAGPCEVSGGVYHVERPEVPNGAALVFIHGYNASGAGMLKARGMVEAALERGYTLVAPSGERMEGRQGRSWSLRPGPDSRDEIAFLQSVRNDAAERFDLDADRMLLAGFSVGGSMAAYLACDAPGSFPAYAPVGGNFWRPNPESCAGPAPMFHTHGWRDGTVPLEGRVLGGGAVRQGDVFEAMRIWRDTNVDAGRVGADGFDRAAVHEVRVARHFADRHLGAGGHVGRQAFDRPGEAEQDAHLHGVGVLSGGRAGDEGRGGGGHQKVFHVSPLWVRGPVRRAVAPAPMAQIRVMFARSGAEFNASLAEARILIGPLMCRRSRRG